MKRDAISFLKQDHKDVRALLRRLEKALDAPLRLELLDELTREVMAHAQIEEEIFYPAFRDALEKKEDEKIYFEAREEHRLLDLLIADLKQTDAGSEEFAGKAKVLKDLIEHHAEEEENEMFSRAKKLMSRETLADLGYRLEERKQELMASSRQAM